ncbi:MAG: hypothetical protein B6U65_01130 [Candidatus Wolframiiraptor sp. EX4484-121]|nr:MAG: hypothetical protein B6U65_01130 [Candidatus Wolframiiraptor sp. EX4484-121]
MAIIIAKRMIITLNPLPEQFAACIFGSSFLDRFSHESIRLPACPDLNMRGMGSINVMKY